MYGGCFLGRLMVMLSLAWGLAFSTITAAAAAPRVVVSIKPVHSLVAGVMAGIGEPFLLIRGAATPHSYSLRPSDARALSNAQLVFWVGEDLETFLEKPLASLAGRARLVELTATPGMLLLPAREGGIWSSDHGEGHDEEHEKSSTPSRHKDGHPVERDLHLWLHPANAVTIVRAAAAALSELDPANAAAYERNALASETRIAELEREIAALLAPVKDQPYMVFHDAYQYFEARFGTRAVGAVTVSPERRPGARRLREIRTRMVESGAACIFSEPQFAPAVVRSLAEGTAAKIAMLDPLAADLPSGPDAYFKLMRNMAQSLRACLTPQS